MAFISLPWNILKVGDSLRKEIFNMIKNNFDDHEQRLNQSETTGGTVFILDREFNLAGINLSLDPIIFYYKATQDFSLTEFRAQIFSKGLITTGTLAVDLQKSIDTNNANFNSVLTGDVTFNYATDAAYVEKIGTINPSLDAVSAGDVIRIEVKSIPARFGGKILINIGGE